MSKSDKFRNILLAILFLVLQQHTLLCDIREFDLIERLIDSEIEGDEAEYALNTIEYYNNYRIKLLNASATEIAKLPSFSRIKANQIKSFITKNPNCSLKDIVSKIDFSELQILILKYCTLLELGEEQAAETGDFMKFRITYDHPLNQAVGYTRNIYSGENFGTNSRIAASISDFKFGFSIDKDAGEVKLIDHYALYLHRNIAGNRIYIGNFKINSGLGLVLGNSFSNSKFSSLINNSSELQNDIMPDLSSFDSKTFRGAAYQGDILLWKNFLVRFGIWGSNMNRAANFDDNDMISSLYTSGLFRTETEQNKKGNLAENSVGANIELQGKAWTSIYTIHNLHYSKEGSAKSGNIIGGTDALLHSVAFQYTFDSLMLASEVALYNSEIATQLNMKYYMSKSTLGINFRYYSPEFRSPFGINCFENSYPSNEIGLGIGLSYKFSKKMYIESVADYFETINRTYYNYLPIKGFEFEHRLFNRINNSNSFYIRLKYENKDEQKSNSNNTKSIAKNVSYRLRVDYDIRYSAKLHQVFRAEYTIASDNSNRDESNGYLFNTELRYKPITQIEIKPSIAIYNTDSYDAAMWVLNSFANSTIQIKSLYEKGIYAKINLSYSPFNRFLIYLQYAINFKPDNESIGSGYNKIENNYEQLLRFNIAWSL